MSVRVEMPEDYLDHYLNSGDTTFVYLRAINAIQWYYHYAQINRESDKILTNMYAFVMAATAIYLWIN